MLRNRFYLAIAGLLFVSVSGAARLQETPPGEEPPPTPPGQVNWATCQFYPAPPGGFGGAGRPLHCTSPGLICVDLDDSCVVDNVAVLTNKALFAEMGFSACKADNSTPMKTCQQTGVTTCMAVGLYQDDCNAHICVKSRTVNGC
jgi:hypothetical protein